MSFNSINGAPINGIEGVADMGLAPVKFGIPAIVLVHADQGLSPLTFGAWRIKQGNDIEASPVPLRPVRFGAHGIQRMSPPPNTVMQAVSLSPVAIGVPILGWLDGYQAESLAPLRLGSAVGLRFVFFSAPLAPVGLASPFLSGRGFAAPSLSPARFAPPFVRNAFAASGLLAARLGGAGVELGAVSCPAESLFPLTFGAPANYARGFRTISLRPVHFAPPVLESGTSC